MKILEGNNLKAIAILAQADRDLLSNGYAKSEYSEGAIKLLASFWGNKSYLECDCQPYSDNPPILGVRKLAGGKYILANLPNRDAHSESCLFSYSHHDHKHTEKEYEPVVQEDEHGYLSVSYSGIREIFRTLVHNSGLNVVNPESWSPDDIESQLIDGARLSLEMTKNKIAKRIVYGYQSFKRSHDFLKDSSHGDYRICFNLISDFDNRSINLSFKQDKAYWYDAGAIYSDCHTNQGPFMATTIMGKHKNAVITLATHIQPVFSRWIPLPIYSSDHRAIAFELIGKSGLLLTDPFLGQQCSLMFNLYPVEIGDDRETIDPKFILRTHSDTFLFANPDKRHRRLYDGEGKLIWFRNLSRLENKRKRELEGLINKVKEAVGTHVK